MIPPVAWAAMVLAAAWVLCAFFSQEGLPGISLLAQLQLGRQGSKKPKPPTKRKPPRKKFSNKRKARKKPKGKCKPTRKIRLVEMIEVVTRQSKGVFATKDVEGAVVGARPKSRKKKTLVTRKETNLDCYKQYVNLPKNIDGRNKRHPEYGRYVELRARVEWDDRSKDGLQGKRVIWRHTHFTATDRPNLRKNAKEGFGGSGGLGQLETTTGKDGWTRVVKFYLSSYGGDEFSVSAELVDNNGQRIGTGLSTSKYQVWRRMWYAITEMTKPKDRRANKADRTYNIPDNILRRVQRSFEDVYLELTDSGEKRRGDFQENLATVNEFEGWADRYCTNKRTPWKIHYVVVNCMDTLMEKKIIRPGISTPVHTVQNCSFMPYRFNNTNWLISAQYRRMGTTVWRDFPRGAARLVDLGDGWYTIRVGFSRTTLTPAHNRLAEIKIKYRERDSSLGKGGPCLHCFICRGAHDELITDPTTHDRAMRITCVHEPGHVFDLVYTQAWKTANADQDDHCKHDSCVMWFQETPNRRPFFHPESVEKPGCRTWMRKYPMTRARMGKWKFPRT